MTARGPHGRWASRLAALLLLVALCASGVATGALLPTSAVPVAVAVDGGTAGVEHEESWARIVDTPPVVACRATVVGVPWQRSVECFGLPPVRAPTA